MREYIVKVNSSGSQGTGFVIARGVAATALHVVAEIRPDGIDQRTEVCQLEFNRLNSQTNIWEQREVQAKVLSGSWDLDDDWVLLQFDPAELAGWDLQPAVLARVREETVSGRRLQWSTWGFPEAHPRLGMETGGHVRTVRAALETITPGRGRVKAIQLYSEEAAAAVGMPVKGLSGAPVVVEGNVVGLLRYSLLQNASSGEVRRNQAGTLYATPIEAIRDPGGLFHWADGDRLPPLRPSELLPKEPFRFLERYEREDCRIFFGRGPEIRQLLSDIYRRDLPPLGLLFGPMGAGKSSFLRAGIEPRLADRCLFVEPRNVEGLLATWRNLKLKVEETSSLAVLDQLEEAWTIGRGDDEFAELLVHLADWLDARRPHRGGLQLLLAFREDRLSSVEDQLRRHGMRWHPFPIRHLDSQGLLETMAGFELDPVVRDHYRIAFEPESLRQTIVDAVLTGNPGAVAPVLQVLLTRLWFRAVLRAETENTTKRTILLKDFELEHAAASGLHDFLEKQLLVVEASCPGSFRTGLALEILAEYTTPGGTATRRKTKELEILYPADSIVPIARLVDQLGAGKLLYRDGPDSHRLVHDSIAPVVQYVAAQSDRPAQRARRTLENRAVEWAHGRVSHPLDDGDLETVELGRRSIRKLTINETRLLQASRLGKTRRARARLALFLTFALGMILVAVLGIWAFVASRRSATAEHLASQRLAANLFLTGTSNYEIQGNALAALLAVSQAIGAGPEDDPNRSSYFARLLALVPGSPEFVVNLGSTSRATLDGSNQRVVLQRSEGPVEAWDFLSMKRLPPPLPTIAISGGLLFSNPPELSADGRLAGIVTPTQHSVGDLRLMVWEVLTGKVLLDQNTDLIFSPKIGSAGWVSQEARAGTRIWNINPYHEFQLPQGLKLSSIARSGVPNAAFTSASGGVSLMNLASPLVVRSYLPRDEVIWTGWMGVDKILVVVRQDGIFEGYFCSSAGCSVSPDLVFLSDPKSSQLQVDSCGTAFGRDFAIGLDGQLVDLPEWGSVGRLCQVGNRFVGVTETHVSSWRTFSKIVECILSGSQCDSGKFERSIPGGAIAVDFSKDKRSIFTLSGNGTILKWPTAGAPSDSVVFDFAVNGKRSVEVRAVFNQDGTLVATSQSDHAGVDVHILEIASGRSVKSRIEYPEDGNIPTSLRDDTNFIRGQLAVMRFDDNDRLLIGVRGGADQLSIIDPGNGKIVTLPKPPARQGLEDAFLAGTTVSSVYHSKIVEQISLDGLVLAQCSLPETASFSGFGRHGEILLEQSNSIEIWTVAACKPISSVVATAEDEGLKDLAFGLLKQADEISGEDGQVIGSFAGRKVTISSGDDGMLAVALGSQRLRMPSTANERSWFRVVSVSSDLRRVILVHDRLDRAPDVGIWDLQIGFRLDLPAQYEIEGGGWSTSLGSFSSWAASFAAGGETMFLLTRSGQLTKVPIGPTQVSKATWMRNLDVGLTGLSLRADGSLYSPPDAATQMADFRRQLETASKEDHTAATLLKLLEQRR